MQQIVSPSLREFVLQATSALSSVTPTEMDAFQLTLELLAWAKLARKLPMPPSSQIASIERQGLGDVLDSLSFELKKARFDDAFALIFKLGEFDAATTAPLVYRAERLAYEGLLDHPHIDSLIPPPAIGASTAFVLPPELAELITGLGELTSGCSTYTPWDWFCHLSTLASEVGASVYSETPVHFGVPRLVQLLTDTEAEIRFTDPIARPLAIEGGKLRLFDVSLTFPPVGGRYERSVVDADWFGRFPEKTAAVAVLSVRHVLSQTRRRTVIAVPNSILFSSGAEKSLREDLLRQGLLRSVIAMPEGLLEGSSFGFAILVMDSRGGHDRVRFIDACSRAFHEPYNKTRVRLRNTDVLAQWAVSDVLKDTQHADDVHSADVSIEELAQNDFNLQVNRYVLPASKKRLLEQLTGHKTIALRELVTTVRPLGPSLTKASAGPEASVATIFEVGAVDLPPFGFISRPVRHLDIPTSAFREFGHQFLRPLDIVLIVKGSVGKVGIVPESVPSIGPGCWVVGQSGIVLRSNLSHQFDPRALYVFLRSPVGQALLEGIVSGATTPLIQLKELQALRVLALESNEQEPAISALTTEQEVQHELDRLREVQASAAANLWALR
jgi:type I restriction enzyme M protein